MGGYEQRHSVRVHDKRAQHEQEERRARDVSARQGDTAQAQGARHRHHCPRRSRRATA